MRRVFEMSLLILASVGLLATAAHAEVAAVAPSITQIRPLLIGQKVAESSILDVDGKPVALRKLLAEKPTVLVVFRGGWCAFCSRQLAQLRLLTATLKQAGWRIVGLSPDPPERLRAATKDLELEYSLYSDEAANAVRALGLAYKAKAGDFGNQANMSRWQSRRSASVKDTPPVLPAPAVYLFHRSGLVVYQYVNVEIGVRLSGEVLLSAAQAYAEAN